MPDLLLELLTEEIPARMQRAAADDLRRIVGDKLAAAGLAFARAESFVTPRRLALAVAGLPPAQPDVSEERRGPRVGAPAPAVAGFLKSAGLATLAECEERDTGKGHFYFAIIHRPGRPTAAVLPDLLRAAMIELPWPKSMRWPGGVTPVQFKNDQGDSVSFVNERGNAIAFVNQVRWVRPIQSIVCLFDDAILPLGIGSVPVGDETRGHRFLSRGALRVHDLADYRDKLRAAFVVLDADARQRIIADGLAREAAALGVRVKEDAGLLDEVRGLVEWPVVLAGRIDPQFMDLPPEVLTTSMRAHQKYFACLDRGGKLAPHFLLVANMAAADGGAAIVAGNERVLRARLSDARFFWDQDCKVPLAARVPKLAERVFHAQLGSMLDKAGRTMRLVAAIVPHVPGADAAQAVRAAELAKADLSSGMVGEFPELQGVMGRYYARHDGEPDAVADAIAEHYSPLGPGDRCPTAPLSVAVALADKIDTLVGFFGILEIPTGSKDPYALRRAALGVIRLILENELRLPLREVFFRSLVIYNERGVHVAVGGRVGRPLTGLKHTAPDALLAFFADRLKVHLRERGVRHDLVAAVFAVGHEDDLVRLLARVAALAAFVASEDGANLLVAYRRAANIVRIEEKKDDASYVGTIDRAGLAQPEEAELVARLDASDAGSVAALGREDFAAAMSALAALRRPVDEFFSKVTVNCEDAALRTNRLRLLSRIRDTMNRVADFSLIEG